MELIDKNNEENEIKHKTEIHQILPDISHQIFY